ncbi:hypothetical protein [Rhizobium sp. Leaf383]|uniref:hypothetical protein n=1 Tax=Rhizobium sp. Leaf383 TaxID=1736357 RepID=UPI001AEC6F0E|nr:hypothetical protein [Rhizobium sp. Leaf383]
MILLMVARYIGTFFWSSATVSTFAREAVPLRIGVPAVGNATIVEELEVARGVRTARFPRD